MKRTMTETDRLAAKMGYRIKRKRDGRLQIVSKVRSTKARKRTTIEFPPMTTAEVESHLRNEWELGITYTTACGMLIGTVPDRKSVV